MCSRTSGLFCACLIFSICHCTSPQDHHHHHHAEKNGEYIHKNDNLSIKVVQKVLSMLMNPSTGGSHTLFHLCKKHGYVMVKKDIELPLNPHTENVTVQKAKSEHEKDLPSSRNRDECLRLEELINITQHYEEKNIEEDISLYLTQILCPAVLYKSLCPDDIDESAHSVHNQASGVTTWIYASVAVWTISVCGFLSVLLIPVIQKLNYKMTLEFLVSMAIGSLSGDALLHLLPHAMTPDSEHHDHDSIYIGFTALIGIYVFFLSERIVSSLRKVKRRDTNKEQDRFSRSATDADVERSKVGEKLSHHKKHGSYGYKFNVVEGLERLDSTLIERTNCVQNASEKNSISDTMFSSSALGEKNDEKSLPSTEACATEGCHPEIVVCNKQNDNHVNSNSHGHSHIIDNSISSVAYMVIMSDVLHNLLDGLAIGAAFSSGVSSGISTSVAVLMHELPHELGDFAMLLKAGMTRKRALCYNLISSLLCWIGTLLSCALGNFLNLRYIFAGTVGMFLYISFVDLLPELNMSTNHSSSGKKCSLHTYSNLIMQLLGITTGTSIMLLIAIYEHDLQHLFS